MEEEPDDALARVQVEALQQSLPIAKPPTWVRRGRPPCRPKPLHRLRRLSDGRVELTLKRPMHDGTRAVAYTPALADEPARQHRPAAAGVDVRRCDKCGGRRRLTAFIVGSKEACEILEQLGQHATSPPDDPGVDPQYPD